MYSVSITNSCFDTLALHTVLVLDQNCQPQKYVHIKLQSALNNRKGQLYTQKKSDFNSIHHFMCYRPSKVALVRSPMTQALNQLV